MSPSAEQLKPVLSALPVPDRAELAHYLLRTLEPHEESAAAEWRALAEQRLNEVREGAAKGIPANQVWSADKG
jgi:putative addiction module component (TIGR02574 family)